MQTHIQTNTNTHMHACVHTYTHMYKDKYRYTQIDTHTQRQAHTHTYAHARTLTTHTVRLFDHVVFYKEGPSCFLRVAQDTSTFQPAKDPFVSSLSVLGGEADSSNVTHPDRHTHFIS